MLGEVRDATAVRVTIPERLDRDGEPRSVGAEDAFTAWLDFESGSTAVLDSSSSAAASVAHRIVVTGEEGVVEVVADAKVGGAGPTASRTGFVPADTAADPHVVPMRAWAEVVRGAVRDRAADPELHRRTGVPPCPRPASLLTGAAA